MGVAFAVYIVITLQNAVQTSPMHTDRMGTRRRRDLQRQRQQSFYLLDRFATRSTPTKIGAIVQVTRIDPGMVFT